MSSAPEFEPPAACVGRIIKSVLPENAQINKDARAAFTRAAGIFIFYLTSCANEYTKEAKRTTISSQDVLNAIRELDFESFEGPLQEFLTAYRKETEAKKASKPKKGQSVAAEEENEDDVEGEGEEEAAVDVPVATADVAEAEPEGESGDDDDAGSQ